MQSKYDSYGGSDDQTYNNIELIFTPFTTIHGVVDRVFGSSSEFGQSLGVNFRDARIDDGALYFDPEKDKYKLFSWKNVTGLSIEESLGRGNEPSVDDAPEVETKNYAGNDKTYELVAARIPEVVDEDGDVVLEAESKEREVTLLNDGELEFGEWEDLEGDRIDIGETITWYNGSEEYGPSASSKSLLETLTQFGSNAVVDEDDLYNWLPDDSGQDILREDLVDRQVEFFTVTRESENGYTYHDPILVDLSTGSEITPNNRDDSEEMEEAREADDEDRSYPEPIADFISSGRNLNLNESRAENLLDELLEDTDNSLTEGMLEESGGRDAVIEQVL